MLVLITFVLALQMYLVSGLQNDEEKAFEAVKSAWLSGKLRQHFSKIVEMQGGDLEAFMTKYSLIQSELDKGAASEKVIVVKAAKGGKLETVNGVAIGNFMVDLNAGRKVFGEPINHDVSMQWYLYPNQEIKEGDLVCKIYHPDFKHQNGKIAFKEDNDFGATATHRILNALSYSSDPAF